MAVTIPNLDRIAKWNPKFGEAFQKLQNYVNQNVTPTQGNRVPAPPISATNIRT